MSNWILRRHDDAGSFQCFNVVFIRLRIIGCGPPELLDDALGKLEVVGPRRVCAVKWYEDPFHQCCVLNPSQTYAQSYMKARTWSSRSLLQALSRASCKSNDLWFWTADRRYSWIRTSSCRLPSIVSILFSLPNIEFSEANPSLCAMRHLTSIDSWKNSMLFAFYQTLPLAPTPGADVLAALVAFLAGLAFCGLPSLQPNE